MLKLMEKADRIGYHYGDLGKGRDTYRKNMTKQGRGTGHFGTGTYFIGHKLDNDDIYTNRPLHQIDFNKQKNLLKLDSEHDAFELHNFLKMINNCEFEAQEKYNNLSKIKELNDTLTLNSTEEDYKRINNEITKIFDNNNIEYKSKDKYKQLDDYRNADDRDSWYNQYLMDIFDKNYKELEIKARDFKINKDTINYIVNRSKEDVDKALEEVIKDKDSNNTDSLSTVFMKALGYNGIDVLDIPKLDNTSYGSVIYDLNESKNDPRIKALYKDGMGTWTLDLADGYETSYGTNYIQEKTRKECLAMLNQVVSKIEELKNINNKLILYHNTTNENAIKISKEGIIPGLRKDIYAKGSEAEGSGIWCTTKRGYGYGGATITFTIDSNDKALEKENNTEYMVFRKIEPNEIKDIDLVVSNIPCANHEGDTTVESDIPIAIKNWGKEKLLKVFNKYNKFIEPYNKDLFKHLLDTGEKYCGYKMKLDEAKAIEDKLVRTITDEDGTTYKFYKKANNHKYIIVYKKDSKVGDIIEGTDAYLNHYINNLVRTKKIVKVESIKLDYKTNAKFKYNELNDEQLKQIAKNINNQIRKEPYRKDLIFRYVLEPYYLENLDKRKSVSYYLIDIINNRKDIDIKDFNEVWRNCIDYAYDTRNEVTILDENKKLQEVSRNELLAKTKLQTKTRYAKSDNYRGFYIEDIDTNSLLTTAALRVTCKVGDYHDTIEIEDVPYWIQVIAKERYNNQLNSHSVRDAILKAVDGMDIKVDCTCPDMQYRFSYKLSKYGAKYGKQETRPAKIRNPNNYGFLCKHLTAILRDKKWLQQVAGTVMDVLEKKIDMLNKFLRLDKEENKLTLPNALARANAKKGFYTKLFKDVPVEDNNKNTNDTENENIENTNNNTEEK